MRSSLLILLQMMTTIIHLLAMLKARFPPLFTELQITGLAFAPFGEANINTLNTKIGLLC